MAWDKDLPDGGVSIAQGDDAIRANNAAAETALDFEHEFATGGVQTGRHKFQLATKATIDALTDPTVDGALAFASDQRPTAVPMYFDLTSGNWLFLDIGTGDVARIDEAGSWTKIQSTLWESITPAGGDLALDLAKSATQYATISTNITITNPVSPVSSHASSVMFMITMSGAGNVISWDTEYVAELSVAPLYTDADGDVNVFLITRLQDGTYLVSSLVNVGAIP